MKQFSARIQWAAIDTVMRGPRTFPSGGSTALTASSRPSRTHAEPSSTLYPAHASGGREKWGDGTGGLRRAGSDTHHLCLESIGLN